MHIKIKVVYINITPFFSFRIEYLEKYKSEYPDLEYDINYMIEKYNEFAKINSKYLSE